jgi:hypothetical protein
MIDIVMAALEKRHVAWWVFNVEIWDEGLR